MTKINTELLAKLMTNTEIAGNQEIVDFITLTLETAGHKSVTGLNPNRINDDGLEEKWCVRHEQYELITEWTVPNSGKLDASCDVAVKQWKEYSKDVKKAEKAMMTNTDESKMIELQTVWITAKNIRSGKYVYPTKQVETEKLESTPVKPKRKPKRK